MPPDGFEVREAHYKLLNKYSVSQLAELSKLSKSYISQVKHGRRPPSKTLLSVLYQLHDTQNRRNGLSVKQAIEAFIKSRRDGLSPRTINDFYKCYLTKAVPKLGLTPTPKRLNSFIGSLPCSEGGKHAYFRALRAFYRWLYSPRSGWESKHYKNPMPLIDSPKIPQRIMPSLTREEVDLLIAEANGIRDKAIIALFVESGLRLSELANIKVEDMDWNSHIVRVIGKGNKEGYAPFGEKAESYLRLWLSEYKPDKGERIWNIGFWSIKDMLDELKQKTGIPCNPHTFRRTFACLLRKAGVDTMTIKDLGRWESLEMVQRYTRSLTFHDSLKFYKAPLS